MSYNYGLSINDLNNAKKKLKNQKDYLEKFTFLNDAGDQKTLLDYSFSANLSKRYYPMILNKVHTFVSQAITKELTPVFLTATLDGFFRDFLKGDYSRWTEKTRLKYLKHIPNNDRNGYFLDYIDEKKHKLTPHHLYKILSHQIHRFYRSKTLQDIRQKYNSDYMAIRVTEPHKKDGVSHIHILMYLPEKFIPKLYVEFHKFFPAPQNAKPINYREDGRKAKEVFPDHFETKGFQTEIRSPAGYILKYILKSFVNLIEGKELDYLQAWYIHNKIPRIITTHSLIAHDVYHHAALLDDDWFYQTEIKLHGVFKRDRLFNTFHLIDENNRELIYQNGLYRLVNNGKVIKEFGEDKTYKMKFTVENPFFVPDHMKRLADCFISPKYKFWRLLPKPKYKFKINAPDFIDIQLPDGSFMIYDKSTGDYGRHRDFMSIVFFDTSVPLPGYAPKKRISDLDLMDWFYNFDFDSYSPVKFGAIKKEMIDRGLLDYEPIDLTDYTDFDFVPDWAIFDKYEYLRSEGIHAYDYDVKQILPKDMKDEWLKIEFDFYKSIDVFANDVYLSRYSRLFNEMDKRGLL
jgi:hypothetical protein